jgi:spermidine synthase
VVALSGAVLMSLELLGSRVLAPRYGSSIYVWGALITVFLTALAAGYALGGRLADRRPDAAVLSAILSAAAVLILPAVQWGQPLLAELNRAGWDVRWSALLASVVLFLPASLAIGMVSPFAVRLAVRHVEGVGSVAGGYSALSTAGSIAGTLLTAFVLIPSFDVRTLLLLLAATLAGCALIVMRDRLSLALGIGAAIACATAGLAGRPAEASLARTLLYKDTAYHHIVVSELERTRYLRFDNLVQGGVRLDDPGRSVVAYEEGLFVPWAIRPGIRTVCQIGLGPGSFARVLSRLMPEVSVDSVEVDPVVADVARRFFLYRESDRVRTIISDGRVHLDRPGPLYDMIVLDAFNSTGTPFHLTTREFFRLARSRLTPDGVFAANFVGGLMGKDARLFWAAYATIRRQFGQVYLLNAEVAEGRMDFKGNLILIATVSGDPIDRSVLQRNAERLARAWRLSRMRSYAAAMVHSPEPPPDVPELTDAHAPVEALQHF